MNWIRSNRADKKILPLADRHYNRQKPGTPQFVPPGKCLVFRTELCDAVWVSSWPKRKYTKHAWRGAWINTLFRNESHFLSSDLIIEAVSATKFYWKPPKLGFVTFVDPNEVPGIKRRGSVIFGYCYLKAGWNHVGFTKGGLWVWQLLPNEMPSAQRPKQVGLLGMIYGND